jgi:bifunctional UDP-N-acetylglucosamine pyrophosphorylase / glucosamine-1-phosphate N-acetyltransferase
MTHSERTLAVVLAAGRGTRMKSSLPKVLHPLCGRPILAYPVRAALGLGVGEVVVVVNPETGPEIEKALRAEFPGAPLEFRVQDEPRGTGHAVRAALRAESSAALDRVLVLSGDTPLLESRHLESLLECTEDLAFLTFELDNPRGYGRIFRDRGGRPLKIVEERDMASDGERSMREVNAGVYFGRLDVVRPALERLTPENDQGEYYLTDIVADIARSGSLTTRATEADGLRGVNHRGELSLVEQLMFERIAARWGERGVTIVGRPLIDDRVELGLDAHVEDGVRLRGGTRILEGTRVDVGSVIEDSVVGPFADVKPYSVIIKSQVGERASIGPFAHLRPDSTIEAEAHIGNFVETKKTRIRRGAKANHLAYLGDGDVGERANLGAGVIFCNYDGYSKQLTKIGEGAFIGSDSQLIAPVEIGKGAYVATGTTVTGDVPEDAFVIGRARAVVKEAYAPELRERLKKKKQSRGP